MGAVEPALASVLRITEEPEIRHVLGNLHSARYDALHDRLVEADAILAGLRDELAERSGRESWTTTGVVLEQLESGQTRIFGTVEDTQEELTFMVELRPGNFFEEEERDWRPGQPPRVMETSTWDVEGEVTVMREMRIEKGKYQVPEIVGELPEQRHTTAEEAVEGFYARCEELAELARSRDPEVKAWYVAEAEDEEIEVEDEEIEVEELAEAEVEEA